MPGKYLEYIRAGRYVVPVELNFLPSNIPREEEGDGDDLMVVGAVLTSKWVERRHWKEIKAMLKPAVEMVGKYNEAPMDKISKSAHVAFGQEVAFGYTILLNKDKCPFVAILDPKRHCWTDDEEDVVTDENSGIADYGGRHKNFTPTRCYIKAVVLRKSGSDTDDVKKGLKKKIYKELGVKLDDISFHLQPTSTSTSGQATSSALLSNVNRATSHPVPGISALDKPPKTRVGNKKKDSRPKRRTDRRERSRSITNTTLHRIRDYSSSEESLMDLPPPGCPTSWPMPITGAVRASDAVRPRTRPDVSNSKQRVHDPIPLSRPRAHRSPGVDYNDSESDVLQTDSNLDVDDEERISGSRGGILSDSVDDVFSSSSLFRNWIEEDDDDFDEELPDIEETCFPQIVKKVTKRSTGNRKKYPGDKSPSKNNSYYGLPDIDDSSKRGRAKKKRNVAIVEPMKHMKPSLSGQISFEEAIAGVPIVNERRKRARSNASPTIERLLSSRSRVTNSAIEILGVDEELPNSDSRSLASQSSAEKKKRKDASSPRPRRARRNKRVNTSYSSRLTPSPFPESPEEESRAGDEDVDNFASQESNSDDSDLEMPVLTKMVPTPDNSLQNLSDAVTPPESPEEIVPPLEPETQIPTSYPGDQQSESHSQLELKIQQKPPEKARRSPSPDIVDHCYFPAVSSLLTNKLPPFAVRKRHASDSDDITSESAYRKTPLLRRKKRKRLSGRSNSAFSSTDTSDQFTNTQSQSTRRRVRDILSPSKQTGDAQTQTLLEVVLEDDGVNSSHSNHLPVNDPPESSLRFPMKIPVSLPSPHVHTRVKMERSGDNEAVNNDSDDDSDEVLFAGQYQAIPILTIDSPRNGDSDDEEEELFSFERPASVKIEPQQSINSVETVNFAMQEVAQEVVVETTPEEDVDEYSFDFVARARKFHTAASRPGGPQGSVTVLNALSYKSTEVRKQADSPPEQYQLQHHHDDDDGNENQPENLSTFQLMNHPGTLQAGFGFLNKVMSNNGNSEDILKQLVGLEKRGDKRRNGEQKKQEEKKQRNKDSDLMPPPPAKRPASPDICSLNPEQQLRKAKSKTNKNVGKGRQEQERSTRPGSPVPSTSSGIRASQQTSCRSYGLDSSDDSDGDDNHYPKGAEPYFREFMSRTQEPGKEYEPRGDEYDLTQASQCMITVVQDYAEKSRTFKKHTKNIENMSSDQFKQYFGIVKPQILGIFEGTESSIRNTLYCNKSHQDIRTLKTLNVIRPFHEEHGNTLNTWLYDLLLPYSGSTLKCADYINYVMRPEAFIRIYACVNDICCETAEKEMLAGPCYEGPFLDS